MQGSRDARPTSATRRDSPTAEINAENNVMQLTASWWGSSLLSHTFFFAFPTVAAIESCTAQVRPCFLVRMPITGVFQVASRRAVQNRTPRYHFVPCLHPNPIVTEQSAAYIRIRKAKRKIWNQCSLRCSIFLSWQATRLLD
jgi:hypothetical protein